MQEKCPECGSSIRLIGQKWECSRDSLHKIPLNSQNGYTTISTPFASVPGALSANRKNATNPTTLAVPLGYPVLRSPAENGIGFRHILSCPFCNYEFRLAQAAIISTINPGKILRQGRPGAFKTVFGKTPLDGSVFTPEGACYQCPNCLLALPYRYESSTNISIGVVGDTSSGKTHYLAALLSQLEEGGMTQDTSTSSVRFIPQTEDTKRALSEYRQILENQETFEGTRPFILGKNGEIPVRKPLIFRMLIQNAITTPIQGSRSVNLVFYDLSGEEIADDTRLAQFGWPILQAQAFIYLADPFSMKGVIDLLPPNKKPKIGQYTISTRRASNMVLDKAIDVIRRYRQLPPDRRLPFPIAIMLSKSDVLEEIIPTAERQNATFLDQTQYDGLVHVNELMHNHEALGKWLESVKETRLTRSALQVPNSSYFAVSATGCSPNNAGRFTSIRPRRCLDPLLWILWRFATGMF